MAGSDYGVIGFKLFNNKGVNVKQKLDSTIKINNQEYFIYKFKIYKVDETFNVDELESDNYIDMMELFNSNKSDYYYGNLGLYRKVNVKEFFNVNDAVVKREDKQLFNLYIKDEKESYHILFGYDVDDKYFHHNSTEKIINKFKEKFSNYKMLNE